MGALIQGLGWRDALDGLLIVIIMGQVFVAFRGTRGLQLLAGLGGLLATAFIASRLGLLGTGEKLDGLWSFWALALIVLFQPELRRALAQVAQSRLFLGLGRAGQDRQSHVIDDVIKAALALAGRRIGALMVFERTVGLRHYAELGVPLDALVSTDLLVSVFLPYSPLHDGAVIIRDNRVVAAGCFLPLSRSAQVGRSLGTRHRAALGLAEETDAVVVAVSEESGRISLAVDGQIESPLDREALRSRLDGLYALGARAPARRAAGWAPALLGKLRR